MNPGTSGDAGDSTLSRNSLVLPLTASEEVIRRKALTCADNHSSEDTSLLQSSTLQLTQAGTINNILTMENIDFQSTQPHEQESKMLNKTMDGDDNAASLGPSKQQETHNFDDASADRTLDASQSQATASGRSLPIDARNAESLVGSSLNTSEVQSAPRFLHPMPFQEDSHQLSMSEGLVLSNASLGVDSLTLQPPDIPQKSSKRSLDDTDPIHPTKRPRIQHAANDVHSEQLQGYWELTSADTAIASSSTPQPSPSRTNWPLQEEENSHQESSTDVSSMPQQTQPTASELDEIATANGVQDNLFESIVFEVAKELPYEHKQYLTEGELVGLGIEPNAEELIAALHNDYDFELEEILRWNPVLEEPKNHDFFGLLCQHIELSLDLAIHLDADSFVKLYSISKDFHTVINGHLTHVMKSCAMTRSPEACKVFDWRLYRSLCVKDPVGRTITNENGEEEVRFAPSLKWLQMVYHRERVVRDILAMMAREGIRTPKGMSLTVKKIWVTMDISTSMRRAQFMHNEEYWTDQDLYNAQMFFIKLDMYFNDPIAGPGDDGTRKLMLGQRSLTTMLRLMKREIMKNHIEVIQWAVRYCYNPTEINKSYSLFGVPPYELGRGHREGWGAGRVHLYRPDELVMREGVRRNLGLEDQLMWMMLWGYVDPVTKENIPVSEEEMYMSDEEEDQVGEEIDELIMRRKQEAEEMTATEEDWVEWYGVDSDDDDDVDGEGGDIEDDEFMEEDDDDTIMDEESGGEGDTVMVGNGDEAAGTTDLI